MAAAGAAAGKKIEAGKKWQRQEQRQGKNRGREKVAAAGAAAGKKIEAGKKWQRQGRK